MGRLIDADALIEKINELAEGYEGDTQRYIMLLAARGLVQEQPTAYDPEKVVEHIQKKHCKKCRNILGILGSEEYCKEQKCQIEELCEIVRKGGVT